MRESKAQIMAGVDAIASRIVGNNTVEYERANGERVIRLHQTDVVTLRPNGDIVLNSGGWRTVTTKARINDYIGPVRVGSDRGQWYAYQDGERVPFADGMVLRKGRLPRPTKAALASVKRSAKLAAAIAKFSGQLRQGTLPIPGAGDCWYCLGFDADIKPGGRVTNSDHLAQHVRENYMHGSLILRALQWSGVRYPELHWRMDLRDSMARTVRRYLRAQLAL